MTSRISFNGVGFGITERCNLSCPHCFSAATKTSEGEFTTDEIKGIIDALSEIGIPKIGWTGGEPLLRKDIEELIAYALKERNIISTITTNGIPLTRKRVAKLRDSGVDLLQISLDGSTPEKNRRIRGARLADFDLIINGLKYCQEAGIKLNLAMMVGRDTMDDIKDYIAMAVELGVGSVRFSGFIPHGFAVQDDIQKRLAFGDRLGDLANLIAELRESESPQLGFDAGFGPLPFEYAFHECHAGLESFYINPYGNVYPCTGLIDERFLVGNLRQRSLKELIEDPAMRQMAEYDRSKIHGPCRSCQYFRVCHGACRGAVYSHTGDVNASFPTCLFRASQG